MAKGFDDDINTNVLIAGLWNASFNLGSFLGPTISGFVVQAFGFRGAIQKTFFPQIIPPKQDTAKKRPFTIQSMRA